MACGVPCGVDEDRVVSPTNSLTRTYSSGSATEKAKDPANSATFANALARSFVEADPEVDPNEEIKKAKKKIRKQKVKRHGSEDGKKRARSHSPERFYGYSFVDREDFGRDVPDAQLLPFVPRPASEICKTYAMATRVAIVGSGIGGLVLAKTLTQYGEGKVEVKLYEAWEEWKTRGGSLGIQQSVEILEKLGLKEKFLTLANRPPTAKYWSDGKEVTDLDLGDIGGGIIMRRDLQQLVVDSLPPEVIFLGHKLESITEDDKEATLTFANGKVEKADIVVGADGIHSVVKKQLFDAGEPVHAGFRLIYSCSSVPVRANPAEVHVNWNTVDGEGYHVMDWTAGAGDKRHDVCLLMMRSEELISDKWDSTIVKEKLKELAAKVAPQHETLHAAIENAEMCFDWGVYIQPILTTWISPKGKVTLIGDAAHATAPFMGQGANMAVMDAWRLGRYLAAQDPDALKKYEADRKSAAEQVVKMSSFMGNMYTTTGWKAGLRNFVVPYALPYAMSKARVSPLKEGD
eukprot:Skav210801  [mRNA]  locus=scaffold275:291633:297016:+ [translate_table: standard]